MKASNANALTTDAQLIQKSLHGDEAAYGQIVERYQSLACSVAYNRCGDLAMSEDLAQEAFMQAWSKLADLKDVTKFKSWLCTIIRNLATRSHEKSTRNVSKSAAPLESIAEPSSEASDPADRVVSAEEEQLVWQALAAIPENYREPMILFYREDQSVAKVAEALEISPHAVKQRLSRGRKFLQEQLAATVESALEKSKPDQRFASVVMLGLAGAKTKTATAGVVGSAAAKSTVGGTGLGALLIPLAKLPIIAWMLKMTLSETRSPREKQLVVRYLIFWSIGVLLFAALAIGSIGWQSSFLSPKLQAMVPAGLMILFFIPMVISFRRMGKSIEQLRIEEKTDTPLRSIATNQNGTKRLFVGSAVLVACCPSLLLMFVGNWVSGFILLTTAAIIGWAGSLIPPSSPTKSFRVYVFALAAIALVGLGMMYAQRTDVYHAFSDPANWPREQATVDVPPMKGVAISNEAPLKLEGPYDVAEVTALNRKASFWWMGSIEAMDMTLTILSVLVWKRVYGKQPG